MPVITLRLHSQHLATARWAARANEATAPEATHRQRRWAAEHLQQHASDSSSAAAELQSAQGPTESDTFATMLDIGTSDDGSWVRDGVGALSPRPPAPTPASSSSSGVPSLDEAAASPCAARPVTWFDTVALTVFIIANVGTTAAGMSTNENSRVLGYPGVWGKSIVFAIGLTATCAVTLFTWLVARAIHRRRAGLREQVADV